MRNTPTVQTIKQLNITFHHRVQNHCFLVLLLYSFRLVCLSHHLTTVASEVTWGIQG